MKRRKFVAAVTGGLTASAAGCVSSVGLSPGDVADTEMHVENIEIDDGQPGPLAVDIEFLETQLSSDVYPRFEVTVENTIPDEVGVATRPGIHPLFPTYTDSLSQELLVWPDKKEEPIEEHLLDTDGCSKMAWPGGETILPSVNERADVLSGQAVERHTFFMLGHDDHLENSCPQPGTYEFRPTYLIYLMEDDELLTQDEWGFEFDLVE